MEVESEFLLRSELGIMPLWIMLLSEIRKTAFSEEPERAMLLVEVIPVSRKFFMLSLYDLSSVGILLPLASTGLFH